MQDHPPQTLLGIKTPSSYVDTNVYMSSSWTELQPRSFMGTGENPVLFSGSHTHRISLWVLNLFIDELKYFVCIMKHGNTTNAPCRCCMKVSIQTYPKTCKYWYVCVSSFEMSFPRFPFLMCCFKMLPLFHKKKKKVFYLSSRAELEAIEPLILVYATLWFIMALLIPSIFRASGVQLTPNCRSHLLMSTQDVSVLS